MPETAPRELMVLVERVVRPLPIPLERQKRLRSEFLQHLAGIYAEELQINEDSTAALERTEQRFGNPEELTAELRKTVPWWQRCQTRMQQSLAQRLDETPLHYTVRLVGRFTLVLFVLLGLILVDHHVFGTEPFSWFNVTMAAAALVSLAMWLGGFLLFGFWAGAEWERPARRWPHLLLFSLGHLASWTLSLLLLMWVAGGTWLDYSVPLVTSLVGGAGSAMCGIIVGVLHHRELLYRREWAQLTLETE